MAYQVTTATKKIAALNKRVRAVQGGSSAGKTISILLLLIDLAQSDEEPTLTSVVAESLPHLKRGALRDFKNIMQSHGYWNQDSWNATDKVYTFETGSKIEFFGADQPDKLRGARRDRLFMNECNNIPFEAYTQLEIRTREFIFLDWNPTNEFWFYTELKDLPEVDHIIVTYLDNEALDKEIVKALEAKKANKSFWRVYGEGQLGEVEGRIYTGWKILEELPEEARLIRYGLDFGFSNDPTAIVGVYKYNEGYVLDEMRYQRGLFNNDIADYMKNKERAFIIADSAEKKSVEELKQYGLDIEGADKGPGSKNRGINYLQSQNIYVTNSSYNLIQEYRNYLWRTDRVTGKSVNEAEDGNDHCLDAARYALASLKVKEPTAEELQRRELRRLTRMQRSRQKTNHGR